MKSSNKKISVFELSVLLVYFILSGFVIFQSIIYKIIPFKYIVVAAIFLVCVGFIVIALAMKKNLKILRKCFLILVCVCLVIANLYLFLTKKTFVEIGDDSKEYTEFSVIVLAENPAENMEDVIDDSFGHVVNESDQNVQKCIDQINSDFNTTIYEVVYETYDDLSNDLYYGNVNAIIINEAFRSMIEDIYPDFNQETKVISTFKFTTEHESTKKSVDVREESFIIYVSGIDTYGSLSTVSRSDVNKLLVVNPNTHKMLIVSIPRDFYIPQVCQGYQSDKLSHTGVFGVGCTVDSVGEYLGFDINYNIRLNFSSLERVVDTLGGINVYSNFSLYEASTGISIQEGMQHMDGRTALRFVRERKLLPNGDRGRIANQSVALEAIINKILSPSILINYISFLDSLHDSFEMNMSSDELAELVNIQLDGMGQWEFEQYSLNGYDSSNYSPLLNSNQYMMIPDLNTVQEAQRLIQAVMNE